MCVCVLCVCTYVEVRGECWIFCSICFALFPCNRISYWMCRQSDSKPQASSWLELPPTVQGVQTSSQTWAFIYVLGIRIQTLMYAQKAFLCTEPSPPPLHPSFPKCLTFYPTFRPCLFLTHNAKLGIYCFKFYFNEIWISAKLFHKGFLKAWSVD